MNIIVKNYVFNPIASNQNEVTFSDYSAIDLERIIRVYNLTTSQLMYEVDPLGLSINATVTGNVFKTTRNFVPMSASDKIHIVYNDPTYNVPDKIKDGRAVVTTPGSRVQISAVPYAIKEVTLTALAGNAGTVVIGGNTVVASLATRTGTPLNKDDSCTIEIDDLSDVYMDATNANDGVSFSAEV